MVPMADRRPVRSSDEVLGVPVLGEGALFPPEHLADLIQAVSSPDNRVDQQQDLAAGAS